MPARTCNGLYISKNTTQLRLIDSGSGDGYRVPVNHTTEFLATVDDHEV